MPDLHDIGAGGLPQALSHLPLHLKQAQEESAKRSGSVSSGNSSKSSGKRKRKNKKREKIPPAAPNTFSECPCTHNNWDNVRVKKGHITLRCRVCQEQWKTDTGNVRKCLTFFQTGSCSKGTQCPNPHIHRYKQSLVKRKMIFGDDLLLPKQVDITEMGQPLPRSKDADPVDLVPVLPPGGTSGVAPPRVPPPKRVPHPHVPTTTLYDARRLSGSGHSQGAPPLLEGASSSFCNSSPGETPLSGLISPYHQGSSFFTKQNKSTFGSMRSHSRRDDDGGCATPTGSERRISIVTDTGEVESLEDEERNDEGDGMTDQEVDDMMERSTGCKERKKYQPTLRREAEQRRAAHSRSGSMENLDSSCNLGSSYHHPHAPVPPLSSPYGPLEPLPVADPLYTFNETSTFGMSGGAGSASGFCTPTTSAPTTPSHSQQLPYRTTSPVNYSLQPPLQPTGSASLLQHPHILQQPMHMQYQPYAPVS
eukprot:TRINITY_DN3636_c0_g1_i1.p1 TRINITY_DN3636_c0_g1~~TRINITY_DN3636_c0_g1_i1.p1  ORF type:complete len:478 (+),score=116.42 TRINITY_DN3636_c0_g1_i1:47-1480(+)